MRVLVTGASGFVGSAVCRALVADGSEVVGLVRDPARAPALAARGVALAVGDMLDPRSYAPLVADVDAVVHAAQLAVPRRLTRSRSRRVFHADAVMTAALAGACSEAGRRLVHTGGCFDWGDHGEGWVDEDTPLTPSPKGVGHARQALELDRAHRERGLDVVRLSPGSVHGPGGLFAAAYVLALAEAPAGASYAVVDDEPLRLRELTDLAARACGVPAVGSAPPALVSLFLGRTPVASLTTFRIDGRRVRAELGWRPRRPRLRDEVDAVVAATPVRGRPGQPRGADRTGPPRAGRPQVGRLRHALSDPTPSVVLDRARHRAEHGRAPPASPEGVPCPPPPRTAPSPSTPPSPRSTSPSARARS